MDCLRFRAVALTLFGICVLNLNAVEQMKATSLWGEYHYPKTAFPAQSENVPFTGLKGPPFSH